MPPVEADNVMWQGLPMAAEEAKKKYDFDMNLLALSLARLRDINYNMLISTDMKSMKF